jgi:hypothetical protein
MSTPVVETPVEVLGSTPGEGAVKLQEQIIPDNPEQAFDLEQLTEASNLERLTEKRNHWGFLEGKDAAIYLRLLSLPAPVERPIDIASLQSKLSSLLPGNRQLERRARKLAWQLSKGRRVTNDWDYIFLSELTPAESHISDDQFVALYPDQVKTTTRKGGRPRKYRTATAQRKGHAERQRRYRERKLVVVADVTKTPLLLAER